MNVDVGALATGVALLVVGGFLVGTAVLPGMDSPTRGYTFETTATDEPATVDAADLPTDARRGVRRAVERERSSAVPTAVFEAELADAVVAYEGTNYTVSDVRPVEPDQPFDGALGVGVGAVLAFVGVVVSTLGLSARLRARVVPVRSSGNSGSDGRHRDRDSR